MNDPTELKVRFAKTPIGEFFCFGVEAIVHQFFDRSHEASTWQRFSDTDFTSFFIWTTGTQGVNRHASRLFALAVWTDETMPIGFGGQRMQANDQFVGNR